MPTYDYQCKACDHQFEAIQMFSEEPLKKCPKCGKKKLQRLLGTGGGFIFKGAGFYTTDSKGKNPSLDIQKISENVEKMNKELKQ